ncbi:hypothetical protein L3067_04245 [Xanthomonas sp. PPL568]|uniref:hypothetical protein n=1 Tax=Xanthomonas indica TaxID=2912242 RepID=UPI001F57660E|nr:hypothetical protein [Xanthomonas indica]MCI2243818.1 hypothetical protein [Xanthomonas indica]
MLPDRWNPRVRLRNWLLKPTAAEASKAMTAAEMSHLMRQAVVRSLAETCASGGSLETFNVVTLDSYDNGPFVIGPDGVRSQPEAK